MNPFVRAYHEATEWFDDTVNNLFSFTGENRKKGHQASYDSKEAYVVVYGHTKSGKTTLILTLLGIKEQHFSKLYYALCGGDRDGETGTPAAAFKYGRSSNKKFQVCSYFGTEKKTKEIKDLKRLTNWVSDFRDEINTENSYDISSVTIRIPDEYFQNPDEIVSTEIIDLPGDNCRSAIEQCLVTQVYSFYLERATRIYFVSTSSHLVVLRDIIKKYKHLAAQSKTRVILSKVGSEQDQIEWIKKEQSKMSKQRLLDNYYEKLAKTLSQHKELRPIEKEQVFLFNAGNTWENLDETTKELLDPIFKEFYSDIIEDIEESAEPKSILRQLSDVETELKKAIIDDKERKELKASSMTSEVQQIKEVLRKVKNLKEGLKQEELGDINKVISNKGLFKVDEAEVNILYNDLCKEYSDDILRNSVSIRKLDKLIFVKKNKLNELIEKLTKPEPLEDSQLANLFAVKYRDRRTLFIFKRRNKQFPILLSNYLNDKLDSYQKKCDSIINNELLDLIKNDCDRVIKIFQRRSSNMEKILANIIQTYEEDKRKYESQIEKCRNYIGYIESEFSEYYVNHTKKRYRSVYDAISDKIKLYFITNMIINAKRE